MSCANAPQVIVGAVRHELLRDVVRRCPAVQENRLTILNQIAAHPTNCALGFDVLYKPGHDISLRRRPSTKRTAMGPLHQPLLFQDGKIFPQSYILIRRNKDLPYSKIIESA